MPEQFQGLITISRERQGPLVATDPIAGPPTTVSIDGDTADVRVGGSGEAGNIRVYSATDSLNPTIHIDGQAGDITLFGGDCAEHFEVADRQDVLPGTVMVLNDMGRLQPSGKAYDTAAVGVVCGAGGIRPGLVLGSAAALRGHTVPIALAGRVYSRFDATNGHGRPGDLLTTASNGQATRVVDRHLAAGAIIGKVLSPTESGADLVDMLVTLR